MFEQTLAVALAALTLYLASFTFAAQQAADRYSTHLTPLLFRRVGLGPVILLSLLVALAFALVAGVGGSLRPLRYCSRKSFKQRCETSPLPAA